MPKRIYMLVTIHNLVVLLMEIAEINKISYRC